MKDSLGNKVYNDSTIEYKTDCASSGIAKIIYDGGAFSIKVDEDYIPPLFQLRWFKVVH